MTVPLYRSSSTFRSLPSCLLAIALSLLAPVAFAAKVPVDDGIHREMYPALGISDTFGRWNKPIHLVYDPDGAPAEYSDTNRVLALLREAYSYWVHVSGVHFEITVDPDVRDDWGLSSSQRDGLVRVSWGNIAGFAGRAGPTYGAFDRDLGHYPYEDGSVELSRDASAIGSDFELVSVLIHELGHLLGLGHSDVPHSVMYANPYNHLRYPRADDIRAMQVLYGPPAQSFDPDQPVAAWLYSAPPQASTAATQFLFKPNAHPNSRNGAYFRIGEGVVTDVTAAADDEEFLVFVGGIGGTSSAIDVNTKLVVVDPAGYLYDERDWKLSCGARSSCINFITVGEVGALKTLPGTWQVHVVDPATNSTLMSTSIPVSGAPVVNRAPTATITAVPGDGPAQARFTLTASDPDGDSIDVVWHPPGLGGASVGVRRRIPSGGSVSLDVDFSQAGTHTFFVEARDTAPRYGNGVNASEAGKGFQTLLRVTVTLPEATVQVASTQDPGTQPVTSPTQQMLAAIARTANPLLVANANGANAVSSAAASFTYGASANGGATTGTNFRSSDNVIVAGGVRPQAVDVGKAGDIFIVARTILNGVETWTYRNANGAFMAWSGMVAHLQPAYSVASLQPNEAFEILNGNLMAAEHRVYIGYRPSGSNTLLYTGQALRINISN